MFHPSASSGALNHPLLIKKIVDDYLNKRKIKARAPSDYVKEFARENDDLDSAMKAHLIDDLGAFGVWSNEYDVFIQQRAKAVSAPDADCEPVRETHIRFTRCGLYELPATSGGQRSFTAPPMVSRRPDAKT